MKISKVKSQIKLEKYLKKKKKNCTYQRNKYKLLDDHVNTTTLQMKDNNFENQVNIDSYIIVCVCVCFLF